VNSAQEGLHRRRQRAEQRRILVAEGGRILAHPHAVTLAGTRRNHVVERRSADPRMFDDADVDEVVMQCLREIRHEGQEVVIPQGERGLPAVLGIRGVGYRPPCLRDRRAGLFPRLEDGEGLCLPGHRGREGLVVDSGHR
jgi:hypothetical protein